MLYNLFSRRKKRAATAATAPVGVAVAEPVDTTGHPDDADGEDRFVIIEPLPEVEVAAEADAAADAAESEFEAEAAELAVVDDEEAPQTDSPLTAAPNVEIAADPEDGFVPERPDMEDASAEDLTTLTVPMLRLRAREVGVTGYSRMKKSELIVAIAARSAE